MVEIGSLISGTRCEVKHFSRQVRWPLEVADLLACSQTIERPALRTKINKAPGLYIRGCLCTLWKNKAGWYFVYLVFLQVGVGEGGNSDKEV